MSRRLLPSSLVACALLGGCAVGPDYTRPEDTPLPESLRGRGPAATATEAALTFGDQSWTEVFGDPVLQALIETALRENHDLLTAAERVLQARAAVTITGADRWPDVSASGSFQKAKATENGSSPLPAVVDPESEQWAVTGDLAWELDFWGRFERATEAARADLLAAEYGRRAVVQGLVSQVAAAYFDLLLLDAQYDIATDTLQSRESSLELVSLRLEQGVVNKVEYYQSESLVLQTAGTLPRLEQAIEEQENLLRFLTGAGPGPIERGRPLREQASAIELPVGLPSQLLERRPDVAQAEQALIAANARIGEAKALLYPTVRLTAFGGLASGDLSDLADSGSEVWGITPSIYMPIFNSGSLAANVEVTESQQREAAVRYSETLQAAFREVADALVAREKRAEIRDWSAQVEEVLRNQVELSRERYRGGVTSYLEVLDSERGYFDAEIGLATSIRDELVAYVGLYRALGGGWHDAAAIEAAASQDPASPSVED